MAILLDSSQDGTISMISYMHSSVISVLSFYRYEPASSL